MKELGGCKTGRVGEPKGGCKVGKKKLTFKIVKKATIAPTKPKMKFIIKPKTKAPPKKKFIIKPKAKPSEIKRVSGVSRAEALKLSPLELFGKLPVALRGMVATPSKRGGGVQIARKSTPALMAEWKKFGQFPYPEGILKKIGKTFGRLPNLKGEMIEPAKYAIGQRISPRYKEITDEQMFNRLKKKFGQKFENAVRENVKARIAKKQK